MAKIRVIQTTSGELVIQHVPSEHYHDGNLPVPRDEVAAQALTTHEALAAAGVTDSSQLDIVEGEVVLDSSKYVDCASDRRAKALEKLAGLHADGAVPKVVKAYLLALVDALPFVLGAPKGARPCKQP